MFFLIWLEDRKGPFAISGRVNLKNICVSIFAIIFVLLVWIHWQISKLSTHKKEWIWNKKSKLMYHLLTIHTCIFAEIEKQGKSNSKRTLLDIRIFITGNFLVIYGNFPPDVKIFSWCNYQTSPFALVYSVLHSACQNHWTVRYVCSANVYHTETVRTKHTRCACQGIVFTIKFFYLLRTNKID